MHSHTSKIIIVLFLFGFLSCDTTPQDDEWNLVALGIPQQLSTSAPFINMTQYALIQTHEPLFRSAGRGKFESKIFSKWTRNSTNQEFEFCLKPDLAFAPGDIFTAGELRELLRSHIGAIRKDFSLDSISTHCLLLTFESPFDRLFQVLMEYKTAPTRTLQNKGYEIGLGPFTVESISKDQLVLKRKRRVVNGFNSIVFSEYKGKDDPILQNRNVEDFNRVFIAEIPDWVKREYSAIPVTLLQTINLVINSPNSALRERIYKCITPRAFRSAFMPRQETFLDIGSVIPIGVLGSIRKSEKRHTFIERPASRMTAILANWKEGNRSSLGQYSKRALDRCNLDIKLKNFTPTEFNTVVDKSPHPYDMSVIAMEASDARERASFIHFTGDGVRLLDYQIAGLKALNDMLGTIEGTKSIPIIRKAQQLLKVHFAVVPLYQEVRNFYYPKRLKNVSLSEDSLTYPEIGEVRF